MTLEDLLKEKQNERASLMLKSAPLRKKRDALREKMAPLEEQARELNKQIREIEGMALVQLDNDIAALQRGLGAKSFNRSAV